MAKIRTFNIEVDGDYTATGAWESEGPICLVRFQSKDGKVFRSRFDVQKEIFIDPFSVKVDQAGIKKLAKSLATAPRVGHNPKPARVALSGARIKSPRMGPLSVAKHTG
jgi:hypothetical protein